MLSSLIARVVGKPNTGRRAPEIVQTMRLRPSSSFTERVDRVLPLQRRAIEKLAPGAVVEHIGATAVPGVLTKGDLDLLVRVPGGRFEEAVTALRSFYAVNQPENWSRNFASFETSAEDEMAIGIQLVVAGSRDDHLFTDWRDRLLGDPTLVQRYNELKLGHEPDHETTYRDAKAKFILAELGDEHVGR